LGGVFFVEDVAFFFVDVAFFLVLAFLALAFLALAFLALAFLALVFLALVFLALADFATGFLADDDLPEAVVAPPRTLSVWPAITREPVMPLSDFSRVTVVL
jgi:hypothetical protein